MGHGTEPAFVLHETVAVGGVFLLFSTFSFGQLTVCLCFIKLERALKEMLEMLLFVARELKAFKFLLFYSNISLMLVGELRFVKSFIFSSKIRTRSGRYFWATCSTRLCD